MLHETNAYIKHGRDDALIDMHKMKDILNNLISEMIVYEKKSRRVQHF